jgi:CheY-like chemotaxis protein
VLLNLFSNGIKYNRAGGKVRTAVSASNGRVRIAVSDTGAGIPPEDMARLFSPFERLGAEQSRVEGTGLGLTLSQRMAEMMSGRLWVESEAGQGSTFFVELPEAAAPEEIAIPTAPAKPQQLLGRSSSVLYIEDNLANLRLVERVLAMRTHFKVLAAMQGRMGLELAREHLPELILLDLHLPDIEGEDLLVRLRRDERTAGIPVIVISADATASRIERLKQLGAKAYLTKPLDVKEFLRVLEETMARLEKTND